ncbi:hypothetical protein [Actibacterium sp. 188UL27-1]|uniref:hypothetical protein n=1 Tax=Actibacterium sp. 188UL27-1 TaxID=2786961 RepID=UPI00195E613C|nr:hypothetical protein [Actibacterium sp. 188UL27-1]MBM7068715.1 hypothetical protein [Actibacterium sp. 188UL27-1]
MFGGSALVIADAHSLPRFIHLFAIGLALGAFNDRIIVWFGSDHSPYRLPLTDIVFIFAAVGLLGSFPGMAHSQGWVPISPYESLSVPSFCITLPIFAPQSRCASAFLTTPPIRHLGNISYGIYLLHAGYLDVAAVLAAVGVGRFSRPGFGCRRRNFEPFVPPF